MRWWRRYAFLAVLFAAILVLQACGAPSVSVDLGFSSSSPTETLSPAGGAEIALISTELRLSTAFGQGVWNSISRFAGESGTTNASYKALEGDTSAAQATLELAVTAGARLVVAMDETVTTAVSAAAFRYPEVDFILLDAPEDTQPGANSTVIRFSAVQAGWLAGYMAVYESRGTIGYVETNEAASRRYALGYLLGAEAAADYRDMDAGSVQVMPLFYDTESTGDEHLALLRTAYSAGVQILFATAPTVQRETLTAAQLAGASMFGIELDLRTAGVTAVGSIQFDARNLIYGLLTQWRQGIFPGGEFSIGTVAAGDVTLTIEDSRLKHTGLFKLTDGRKKLENTALVDALAWQVERMNSGPVPTPVELGLVHVVLAQQTPPEEESASQSGSGQQGGATSSLSSSSVPTTSGSSAAG